MNKFELSNEEELQLRFCVMLLGRQRSLYEYFCELPLEKLKHYPQKGYRWWFGRAARSPQALEIRDYILHWRLVALDFQKIYTREYLKTRSLNDLRMFLHTYIRKTPLWAYEKPLQDAVHLLFHPVTLWE